MANLGLLLAVSHKTLQKPGTARVQRGKSTESRGLPLGPSKGQRSTGVTHEGRGSLRGPKQVGQLSYTRVAQEGLRCGGCV